MAKREHDMKITFNVLIKINKGLIMRNIAGNADCLHVCLER